MSKALIVHPAYVPNQGIPAGVDLLIASDVLDQSQYVKEHQAADQEDLDWLLDWDEEEDLEEDQSCGWSCAPAKRNYRRW